MHSSCHLPGNKWSWIDSRRSRKVLQSVHFYSQLLQHDHLFASIHQCNRCLGFIRCCEAVMEEVQKASFDDFRLWSGRMWDGGMFAGDSAEHWAQLQLLRRKKQFGASPMMPQPPQPLTWETQRLWRAHPELGSVSLGYVTVETCRTMHMVCWTEGLRSEASKHGNAKFCVLLNVVWWAPEEWT